MSDHNTSHGGLLTVNFPRNLLYCYFSSTIHTYTCTHNSAISRLWPLSQSVLYCIIPAVILVTLQLLCCVSDAQSEQGGKTLVVKRSISATLKMVGILWHVKNKRVHEYYISV